MDLNPLGDTAGLKLKHLLTWNWIIFLLWLKSVEEKQQLPTPFSPCKPWAAFSLFLKDEEITNTSCIQTCPINLIFLLTIVHEDHSGANNKAAITKIFPKIVLSEQFCCLESQTIFKIINDHRIIKLEENFKIIQPQKPAKQGADSAGSQP